MFSFTLNNNIVYADDPITVASADEFKTKLNATKNGSFIQIADFELSADWSGPTDFHGTYDGNGYTIKGNSAATEMQYLFSTIAAKNWTTTIKDVYLEDCGLIFEHTLGAASTNNKLNIENCHIDILRNVTKTATTQAWLSFYVGQSGTGSYGTGVTKGYFKDSSVNIHDNVNIILNGTYSGGNIDGSNPGGIGLFVCRGLAADPGKTSEQISFSNCFVYLGKNAKVIFNYKNNRLNPTSGTANIDAGVGGFVASSRTLSNSKFENCYVFMDTGSEMKSVKQSGGRDDCVIPVGSFFGSVKGNVTMNNCYCFNFGKLSMDSNATPFTNQQKSNYLHLDIGVEQTGTSYSTSNCKFFVDTSINAGIDYLKTGVYTTLTQDQLTNPTTFDGMLDTTSDYSDDSKLFIMDPAGTKSPGGGSGLGMPYLKQEVENQLDHEVVLIPFTGKTGEMTVKVDAKNTAYTLGNLSTITVDFGDETTPNIIPIDSDKITDVDGVSALYVDMTVSQDWLNDNFTEDDIGKEFVVTYAFTKGKVVRGKFKIVNGNPPPSHSIYQVPNTGIK